MATALWTMICERVLVDQTTNTVSLIDVMEEITAPSFPIRIPLLIGYVRYSSGGEGFAITSMVLGIIGLVMFCVWFVSWPCSLLGIIFGYLGLEKRFRVLFVEELPNRLARNAIYVMGEPDPWAAALLCPCGCGSVIQLSLLWAERPSWRLNVSSDGWPTLSPSVWRTSGCRSHFFLRNGQVVWCGPDDAWEE